MHLRYQVGFLFYFVLTLLFLTPLASAQQLADPEFKPLVENPAYSKSSPRVLFDEAHNNSHTMAGRYQPFVDLIMNDGYRVVRNRESFTKTSLKSFKVLIIANALGAEETDDAGADRPAFTDEECEAVRDWVKNGGALLLIADHRPFGDASVNMAKQFGVEMSSNFTIDPENCETKSRPEFIVFSREKQLIREHPITQGRGNGEKINRVIVFQGQSHRGSEGSTAFLQLADTARDVTNQTLKLGLPLEQISAAGRGQGIAVVSGKGRVVVLGEADMISALQGDPPGKEPIGMNYPGTDNKQLALNIMHWLSGLLSDR